VVLGGSGCKTPLPAPTVNVTGVWHGTWRGPYGSGTIGLALQQTDAAVVGEMTLSGGPAELAKARVEGTVVGNTVHLKSVEPFRAELSAIGDEITGPFHYRYENAMSLRRTR